jgi:hypothetical protein
MWRGGHAVPDVQSIRSRSSAATTCGLHGGSDNHPVVAKTSAQVVRMTQPLILKRGSLSHQSGQQRDDDYDVLESGVVVGRIFCLDAVGPQGKRWMWASGHSAATVKRAAHGYEPTREAAMAAFAKRWRRSRLD